MKILNKIFALLLLSVCVMSCDDEGEVFSGSPAGTNVKFETIVATVATSETNVVAGQSFPITLTIPNAFPVDVSIEVVAFLPNSNKRSRKYVIIKAGETQKEDTMNAPNADTGAILPFNLTVNLYLNAIANAFGEEIRGFSGVQYSLTSNVIELGYGDSSIVTANSNRFGVRLDWPGPYGTGTNVNDLNIRVIRADNSVVTVATPTATTQPIHGSPFYATSSVPSQFNSQFARYETVNFLSTAPNDVYTIEIYATKLVTTPTSLPYRFTIRFPDEKTKVFAGVLENLVVTPASGGVAKLRITKTTVDGIARYEVTPL